MPEAAAALHKASELEPKCALYHLHLGQALQAQNKISEAEAAFRKAIELDPKSFQVYAALGIVLRDQSKLPEAEVAFRKAIELDPRQPWPHHALAHIMRHQGKAREAIAAYLKASDLDVDSATGPNNTHLRAAICTAAVAGVGKDKRGEPLTPGDQAELCGKALEWLQAEVARESKLLATDPATAEPIHRALQQWLSDTDLSWVREAEGLAALPPEEREAWTKLWSDVRDLQDRTQKK